MRLTRKVFLRVSTVMATGLVLGCGDDESGGSSSGTGGSGTGGSGTGGGGTGATGTGGSGTGATGTGGSATGGQGGSSQSGGAGGSSQGGGGGQSAGDCLANGTDVAIAGNHGHSMTVSAQDVMDGIEKTYDMPTPHAHAVTVTVADFADLAAGTSVMATSTLGGQGQGHTHVVTISCA